jgi:hypothetical protein
MSISRVLAPADAPAVFAPLGSWYMELVLVSKDLRIPQTVVSATDIAML